MITRYLIATIVFFGLDMAWLGFVAKNFYRSRLSFILSENVNWPAAIVFYFIYIAGIYYFAIHPSILMCNWQVAAVNGALLGFLCYATYDLTNMATIANWPISIVIVDIIWGTALTSSVAVATYFISNYLSSCS